MQSPLVGAALEQLKPAPGYTLVKAYIQPDGNEEFVVLLLDYGIQGCKKYRVKVERLSPALTPTPLPKSGEGNKEVKAAVKRRR